MKTIDHDIKEQKFKRVYLLYGEERYLIRQYAKKLIAAMVPQDDTMNFTSFEGKDINQREVIDLAETLPFFAERRVIFIEKSGLFKKTAEDLATYISSAPETTFFVFLEEEIDKRNKLFKEVSKLGYVTEIKKQTDEILYRWVHQRLKKEGKTISDAAYQLFISKTGSDMENIEMELEKLVCYTMGKEGISPEDVHEVVTERTENKVFEMVDCIVNHQQKKALELYYDLIALKEAPIGILYLLTRHYRILILVKTMSNQGFSQKEIASKAKCPEWAVRKYQTQARHYEAAQLQQAVADAVEFETMFKTGQIADYLAVEMFIVQYSK